MPTHCPFCGVQCGMYLRVGADGKVFGVEPRNHDINKMRMCPKGVTAYQQLSHPDRLLTPFIRDGRDAPLRAVGWDAALDRVVLEMSPTERADWERRGREHGRRFDRAVVLDGMLGWVALVTSAAEQPKARLRLV